jgi:hypothetical protein
MKSVAGGVPRGRGGAWLPARGDRASEGRPARTIATPSIRHPHPRITLDQGCEGFPDARFFLEVEGRPEQRGAARIGWQAGCGGEGPTARDRPPLLRSAGWNSSGRHANDPCGRPDRAAFRACVHRVTPGIDSASRTRHRRSRDFSGKSPCQAGTRQILDEEKLVATAAPACTLKFSLRRWPSLMMAPRAGPATHTALIRWKSEPMDAASPGISS